MADPYLYEFLYRGMPDGSGAWHVIVAVDSIDGFGDPIHSERTYNMEQAAAAGYSLPALLSALNTNNMKDLEARTAERDALQTQLSDAQAKVIDVQSQLSDAQAKVIDVQSQLDAAQAQIQKLQTSAAEATPSTETPPQVH